MSKTHCKIITTKNARSAPRGQSNCTCVLSSQRQLGKYMAALPMARCHEKHNSNEQNTLCKCKFGTSPPTQLYTQQDFHRAKRARIWVLLGALRSNAATTAAATPKLSCKLTEGLTVITVSSCMGLCCLQKQKIKRAAGYMYLYSAKIQGSRKITDAARHSLLRLPLQPDLSFGMQVAGMVVSGTQATLQLSSPTQGSRSPMWLSENSRLEYCALVDVSQLASSSTSSGLILSSSDAGTAVRSDAALVLVESSMCA